MKGMLKEDLGFGQPSMHLGNCLIHSVSSIDSGSSQLLDEGPGWASSKSSSNSSLSLANASKRLLILLTGLRAPRSPPHCSLHREVSPKPLTQVE